MKDKTAIIIMCIAIPIASLIGCILGIVLDTYLGVFG